jgi:transcriptional regulator CtsR
MDEKELKMRTDKELIELLLDKVVKDFNFLGIPKVNARGLCRSINLLMKEYVICYKEERILTRLITEAAIKYGYYKSYYWWNDGRKRPRVKFLQRMLKELQ